jgi:hypothetical protein
MSVSFPTKSHFFYKLIPIIGGNIDTLVKHAQSLNTHAEKFGKLGLTAGI